MKLLKHVVRNMDQNVYIYFDENTKEGVVVDPGNDAEAIEKIIDDNNVDVKAILLTHGHSDHTGAANAVKKRYNIPICAHKWEVPVLDDEAISFSSMFGGEGKITVDKEFNDGDEFKFNNCTLKVIHTPGHTQGGVCYYDAEHNVLFSGDTLFYGSVGRHGISFKRKYTETSFGNKGKAVCSSGRCAGFSGTWRSKQNRV